MAGCLPCVYSLAPPQGEDQAAAHQRHQENISYRSTMGEHLDGKPVKQALRDRNAERAAPAPVDDVLRRALRPSGRPARWRPETAPAAVGGPVFAGAYYDPHEHGPVRGGGFRPLL